MVFERTVKKLSDHYRLKKKELSYAEARYCRTPSSADWAELSKLRGYISGLNHALGILQEENSSQLLNLDGKGGSYGTH